MHTVMDTMSTKAMKRMVRLQMMRAGSTVLKVKKRAKIVRQSRKRKRLKSRNRKAKKNDNKIPLRPQTTMRVTIRMRRKAGAMWTGPLMMILLYRSLTMYKTRFAKSLG